jgi:DNA mismatch endonuclease, patch repair protein
MERALRKALVGGGFGNVPDGHSRRMAAIRSKGNRTTEARFRAMLVRASIRGWTMQTNGIAGKPDFFFPRRKVAVFVDGCFWHGCPRCGHVPSVNRSFWKAKIKRNRERDQDVTRRLARLGITTIRFWEHELRLDSKRCILRMAEALSKR